MIEQAFIDVQSVTIVGLIALKIHIVPYFIHKKEVEVQSNYKLKIAFSYHDMSTVGEPFVSLYKVHIFTKV